MRYAPRERDAKLLLTLINALTIHVKYWEEPSGLTTNQELTRHRSHVAYHVSMSRKRLALTVTLGVIGALALIA